MTFRSKVRDELQAKGYVVKIMEEHPTDSGLDEKFEQIVSENEPVLYIAFFHKDVPIMDGVIFEMGFISGRYGANNVGNKLLFLGEKGYSWDLDNDFSYVKSSLSKVRSNCFDEELEYRKASTQIHYFVGGITSTKGGFDRLSRVLGLGRVQE